MVTGPWGSTATFLYSRIWNFSTVLTKNKFPGRNFLNLCTVFCTYRVHNRVHNRVHKLQDGSFINLPISFWFMSYAGTSPSNQSSSRIHGAFT